MFFKSRRFVIWFISLMVIVAAFLLYSRISETPPIKVDTSIKSPGTAVDPGESVPWDNTSTVGVERDREGPRG